MSIPFLELKPAYEELQVEIDAAVATSLERGWYIGGADVSSFESDFAAYVGAKHCVGVGNGLDAIAIALRAYGIGVNDEVIVPSHTFIATWLAVSHVGATIVPVEPTRSTMNIDPNRIEEAITPKTKAIVPVHLYGLPAAMEEIQDVANRHGIPVIEDAAQAHGARYRDKPIGGLGNTCCWSFYPGKNLGAFGDGGAVTTDDPEVAQRVRTLANYGSEEKYVHNEMGVNSRLDPVQAAVLRVRLSVLDSWNQRRRKIADRYREALSSTTLQMQSVPEYCISSNHLFVVRSPHRDQLSQEFTQRGVKTLIHYPIACRDQGAYRDADIADTPVASEMSAQVLSLPMGPHLKDEQVTCVIETMEEVASIL